MIFFGLFSNKWELEPRFLVNLVGVIEFFIALGEIDDPFYKADDPDSHNDEYSYHEAVGQQAYYKSR